MVKVLVVAAVAWPLLLVSAAWTSAQPHPAAWSAIVYVAASRVCHQLSDRSFHTAGVQWPVCARCSGLYLSAPIGACLAAWFQRRRLKTSADPRIWLAAAALPTAITLVLEWAGWASPGNVVRMVSALPLGAAIAFVLVRTAAGTPQPIE